MAGQGVVDQLPICFYRIPAKELLDQGFARARPQWLLLNEDKVRNSRKWAAEGGGLVVLRPFCPTAAHRTSDEIE